MSKPNAKVFELAKEYKSQLDDVFYSEPVAQASFTKFWHVLHHVKKDIPREVALLYYNNTEVRQVFKPYRKPKTFNHHIAFYPFQKCFMDTMYLRLTKSTLAFSCIIDLFSRYAYAKMYTLAANTQAITSAQARATLEGFFADIRSKFGTKMNDVGIVIFDAGSEFKGRVTDYVLEHDILHKYSFPDDKRQMAPVERFNGTLRLYLEKYRFTHGRITPSALQQIMDSYNVVPHAGNPSPVVVLKSKDAQLQVEDRFYDMHQEAVATQLEPLRVEQGVRVLLERTVFQKLKPVWSTEIYFVKSYDKKADRYTLEDDDSAPFGTQYTRDELQPIRYLFKKKDR